MPAFSAYPHALDLLRFLLPLIFGWVILYFLPLGRRRLVRESRIAAPAETIWRHLDPRAPGGGWRFVDEARNVKVVSETPLRLSLARRPRMAGDWTLFDTVKERCDADAAAGRLVREGGGVLTTVEIAAQGALTRVSIAYEKPIRGLLDHEQTRLQLARDLDAFSDMVIGADPKAAPMLRVSGWRLALLWSLVCSVEAALILAPTLRLMGLGDKPATFAESASVCAVALFFFLTLIAVTLVHETGHALGRAAFGRRGLTVSLAPFDGFTRRLPETDSSEEAEVFETGAACLAGPALLALVAFAVIPGYGPALALFPSLGEPATSMRLAFWFLAGVHNWGSLFFSDGRRALRAIFPGRFARWFAFALGFALMLRFPYPWAFRSAVAAPSILLLFVLIARQRDDPFRWRRLTLFVALLLVAALCAYEDGRPFHPARLGRN